MAKGHRLGGLQMGEAGHDGGVMPFGLTDQGGLQIAQLAVDGVNRAAHPQAKIGGHLVVARPPGVQRPAASPFLAQAGLDIHVNVFQSAREDEPVAAISSAISARP